MTAQLAGGYSQPPGFSYSELEFIVVEGNIQVGDKLCGRGHYFFVPAGYSMPAISSEQGALLLMMYNTGEPSLVESDEHHPLSRTELYHDVDTYADIVWAPGNLVSPSVASGCMIKLLNLQSADLRHDVPVLHDATFPPGQHLLPRLCRGGLPSVGHVMDDAVRRSADRRLLLAPALHQSRRVRERAGVYCHRTHGFETLQSLPLQPVEHTRRRTRSARPRGWHAAIRFSTSGVSTSRTTIRTALRISEDTMLRRGGHTHADGTHHHHGHDGDHEH